MNEKEAFLILGIEETKEEDEIKQAYRRKLVSVNPEDDPEGFKKLRKAYECACEYAKKVEYESGLGEDTSPEGIWMKSVEETYHSLSRRMDVECWKQIFNESAFVDLDTNELCRERFLRFLMDNFRFKTEVWNYLDQVLGLRASKSELYEAYPKDFVDYVLHQCEQGEWFPYDLLEGDDTAEYDMFVSRFFDMSRRMEDEDSSGASQLLEEVDSLEIRHPYMELERARYWQLTGKSEEADRLIDEIVKELGPADGRCCYIAASVKWKLGKKEEAAGYYEGLLREVPDHYLANKMLGRYYMEKEEYEKAKEYCINAIKSGHDPEVEELLRKINLCIMDQFRSKLKEDENDMRARLELGWCYLQNEEYTQGIALMTAVSPKDDENKGEYHNLLGKLYYAQNLPDKSEIHLKQWIECLEQEHPENEKETSDRIRRFGTAHAILAQIYRRRGEQDKSWYEKAMKEIDQAIEYTGGELGYRLEKGYILNELEQYEDCVKLCTAILDQNSGYFPALVLRQEMYSKLRDAQGVIGDYFAARAIFGGFSKIYELAAEVYYDFRHYEDVEAVIKAAEENQVESNQLDLYRGKLIRNRAETIDEGKKALEYLLSLEKKYQERTAEPKDWGELYCEIGLCYDNIRQPDEALAYMDKAIKATDDNLRYYWIMANFLEEKEEYQKELDILLKYKKEWEDGDSYHYHLGEAYYNLRKKKDALAEYQKALEINPDHKRANSKIVDIYTGWLENEEDLAYLGLAVPYADRQLELLDRAYYYIERGLLYMAACVWDKALADFNRAAELEPDNLYAHNNAGCVYKYTGDYEKALEEYEKAVKIMEEADGREDTPLPYGNMGDTYERMGDWEQAYLYYMKNIERFPDNVYNYRSIAELCRKMKRYGKAIEFYKKAEKDDGNFQEKKADTKSEEGSAGEALECYKNAWKAKAITESEYHLNCGQIQLYLKKNYLFAEMSFKKAVKTAEEDSAEYRDALLELARFYYIKGKKEKASLYAKMGLENYVKMYKSIDQYLVSLYYQAARYYRIGTLYFLAGDMANAQKYFNAMEQNRRCRKCTNNQCVEQQIGQALLCESRGEKDKAKKFYEAALKEDPNVFFAVFMRNRLV